MDLGGWLWGKLGKGAEEKDGQGVVRTGEVKQEGSG